MRTPLDQFLINMHWFIHKFGVHLFPPDENGLPMMPESFRADMEREFASMQPSADLDTINAQLEHIKRQLTENQTVKDWYSTAELATIVNRAEWTVRDWCRKGRIECRKRKVGRGNSLEWEIPRSAVDYYLSHGRLPRLSQ